MEVVKNRKPLAHNPTASFTMKRGEYKEMENVRLIEHFASWLGKVSGRPISADTFEQDILDGVALCTVMSKIQGSGVERFHQIPSSSVQPLEAFKSRENLQSFVNGCKRLNLPVHFGTEDLEKSNIGRVASTLVFLAHVAHSQGVTVEEMDQEILDKVEEMDKALAEATSEESESKSEEGKPQELTWWQNILVKLGFGDWISSLNIDSLKAYLNTLKENAQKKIEEQKQKIEEQTQAVRAKIDEQTQAVRSKIEEQKQKIDQTIEEKKLLVKQSSERILEKTSSLKDALPEVIRSRLN